MNVVMIGTGNVATVLSKLIIAKGHTIKQIVGRDNHRSHQLSQIVASDYCIEIKNIALDADIYIIAVVDAAVAVVAAQLHLHGKLVIHTAGALTKHVLHNTSSNYGVIWPLQTLRKETEHIPEIPFILDANNDEALNLLQVFALTLSNKCGMANDAARVKLHVGAVVVSNFTNYLFALVDDFCEKENLDFTLFQPLINETVQRLKHHAPKDVQTGPAIRGDRTTINKHINLLSNYPELSKYYKLFSNSIHKK